jgi:hypothetical protein
MPPETLDSLDKDRLKLLVLELLAQNKALKEQISVLLVRIAGLEAHNGQPPKTPTNSSVPPSKGQKANRPEAPAQKKGRKGRPGVARALCPDPDVTREIYAASCSCGAALSPADQPDVFAYDLIDLPPIKPVTTRINLHKPGFPWHIISLTFWRFGVIGPGGGRGRSTTGRRRVCRSDRRRGRWAGGLVGESAT